MTGPQPNPGQPAARRRFAPVPIETTFERFRKGGGPAPEPTPSPSPRSDSPPPSLLWTKEKVRGREKEKEKEKEKRRFAPQLIESSRRSRRTGDVGPATKPTDKTDITPYHNHIYAPKHRKKHRKVQSLARRESCDDETAGHVFEMLAREAEKRLLEEAALAAFPNSRARAGGAEHFAIRESSEDDDDKSTPGTRSRDLTGTGARLRTTRRSRRDSLTEDVGWALREMQEHSEQLAKVRAASLIPGSSPYMAADTAAAAAADDKPSPQPPTTQVDRISTIDLDRMSMESPPSDPIWTTTARQSTQGSASIQPIGESFMPFIPEEPVILPSAGDGFRGIPSYARKLREAEGELDDELLDDPMLGQSAPRPPASQPIGEVPMPLLPPASNDKPAATPYSAAVAAGKVPVETGFRGRNAYAGYRNRDIFASEREVNRLRRHSPPMLGKDLVFPKCASPKQTKLEPEFLWTNDCLDETHRDATGQHGLWHGFCFAQNKGQAVVPIQRDVMLATPFPPSTPGDPFAQAFALSDPGTISEEPESLHPGKLAEAVPSAKAHAMSTNGAGLHPVQQLHHAAVADPKGLHMLKGLDERLRQEKAAAELEEKIAAEFTDRFVTQVYNYLSLGYPAMARSYDDELSKISRISVDDLGRDDNDAENNGGRRNNAKGHISLDDDEDASDDSGPNSPNALKYNHDDCPRWRALKLYIFEWARQHPDLDSISPLAWGMRERRGSWGV